MTHLTNGYESLLEGRQIDDKTIHSTVAARNTVIVITLGLQIGPEEGGHGNLYCKMSTLLRRKACGS